MTAPIALFVHDKPELTARTLLSLRNNSMSGESELYIFCDGPIENSDDANKANIRKVREIANSRAWCKKVKVLQSQRNRGAYESQIYGLNKLLNEYGKVIVIKDTLELSSGFLEYMNKALDYYEKEDKVMHISGFSPPALCDFDKNFFIQFPYLLGWGTWKRSWDRLELNSGTILNKIKELGLKEQISLSKSNYTFLQKLKQESKGKSRSIHAKWFASILINNGLVLYPDSSFVSHWDDSTDNNRFLPDPTNPYSHSKIAWRNSFTEPELIADPEMETKLSEFFRSKSLSFFKGLKDKFI